MTNIVIIGSGFAGCTAVKTLRKNGYRDNITLVSPKAELFYYPSLIWVASGARQESDLRIDLTGFFSRNRVNYIADSVQGINAASRQLITGNGEIEFDYAIIASGGRYIRKLPGIEHAHIACSGWEATRSWADKLATMDAGKLVFGFSSNPNEPSAMRGGPVFEFLFGTDTLLKNQGRRVSFELHFVSPAPRPGARMGEKAVDRLLNEMSQRNVHTHLGSKLKSMQADRVITETETVESDLILFIPGMTGPAWAADSGLGLSDGGFFQADEYCRVTGSEHVYVAGDAGSFPGPDWKPKQAHMADLQAEAAAKNILSRLNGGDDHHTFKTELICIIDSNTTGTMVYRDPKRSVQFKGKPFHWAKSLFEWNYLRAYR